MSVFPNTTAEFRTYLSHSQKAKQTGKISLIIFQINPSNN